MRDSFDSGKMPCPQRARHLGDLPGPALPRERQNVPARGAGVIPESFAVGCVVSLVCHAIFPALRIPGDCGTTSRRPKKLLT